MPSAQIGGIHTCSEQEGVKSLHLKFPVPHKCCTRQAGRRRAEGEDGEGRGSPDKVMELRLVDGQKSSSVFLLPDRNVSGSG